MAGSAIQTFSEAVADDMGRTNEASELVGAVDWAAIIEMVMQLAMSLLANCGNSDAKVIAAIKSPTLFQRAFLGREIKAHCEGCLFSRFKSDVGTIRNSMIKKGASLDDASIVAMISEARGLDNSTL